MNVNQSSTRRKGLTQGQIDGLVVGQELIYNFGKDSYHLQARVKVIARTASTISCSVRVLQVLAHGGQVDTITGDTLTAAFMSLSVIPVKKS